MNYIQKISDAIEVALDYRGIELTHRDIDAAALAVAEALRDELYVSDERESK